MHFPPTGRRCFLLALALSALCLLPSAQAGSDSGSALDYTRSFLERYPRFRAEGIMTSSLPDRPSYRCKVEVTFNKADAVLFEYNTDGAKNIIPYDLDYANHRLEETIYNRDRSEIIKSTVVGAPMRTIFNFVWDLLREAEQGVGLNSLIFNGLMSLNREDNAKGTIITLNRRIPAGPVEMVRFTFDDEQRLKRIDIKQSEGNQHKIEIRRFRGSSADNDLPRVKGKPTATPDEPKPTPAGQGNTPQR